MKLEQIIILAFVTSAICYVSEIVWWARNRMKNFERLKIAKEKGWGVKAKIVKTRKRYKNTGTEVSDPLYTLVVTYECEIDGKKVRKKYYTPDYASHVYPSDLEIYYDAENNNKVLNLDNDNKIKVMLLIPILVFVGIILFGKFVLGVV